MSFYDYLYGRVNGTQDESKQPTPNKDAETKTDTGRPIYGGGGIAPDEAVKTRTMTAAQVRMMDPVFGFARELVYGRVNGFPDYKVAGMPDFEHNLQTSDMAVDDRLYAAFKDYVAAHPETFKMTAQQLDRQREFISRQLRYDLATAAYGSVKAQQVLVLDDPQVVKGIESLPRAGQLAAAASRGRNPQSRSFED
jgi:carboxyl-terminal processing protease